MTISIRPELHSELAATIVEDIHYAQANYYYFLGKVEPWGSGDTPPVSELGSVAVDTTIRSNALFYKKVRSNDVSLVATRYDWQTGVVYDYWDHTVDMRTKQFYVLSDGYRVYKCLSNNGGVASTVAPSGTSYGVISTADGYKWKYMFSIPSFKVTKFTSSTHFPVQRALSDSFYNKGAIEKVYVTASGSGYADTDQTAITVTGSTTGSGASATAVVDSSGKIVAFNMISGGTGYTSGVKLGVTTTNGYGAKLTANIVGGVVSTISIVDGGSLYENGDVIQFNLGGAVIIPALNSNGSITSLHIMDGGAGYDGTVTCSVTTPTTGTGAYGNPTALVSAIVYQGSVVQASIVDPGVNYPLGGNTTITVNGDGTGASFTPVVVDGKIIDVVINNTGTGYTYIVLTANGTGTGAEFEASMKLSDFTSDQAVVEQTSVEGAIYHINVVNGGNNYTASTTVTISGDGTGATAVATVVSGVIIKITVTNAGSGYSYVNLAINDVNRTLVGTVVDAVAYACLPPNNGHGTDAITELFADTLAINSQLRQETVLNSLLQDYRQYGLVKNPTNVFTGKLITSDSVVAAYECQFIDVTGLVIDEVLTITNAKFRVLAINGLMVTLQPLGKKLIVPTGTLVAESNNARTYVSSTILSSPVFNKYSGKLLYVSDENPFSFSAEQGITVKTFLKF